MKYGLNRSCLQTKSWSGRRHSELPQGSPQHHLQGIQEGDGIEEGVGKILRTKSQGFLRTGAETASRTGPGAGTEPRIGGRDQGQALGGLPLLRKDGADLCRNSPKEFKPGSWTTGGGSWPTTSRRLLRVEDMSKNRFELISKNSILTGTNFQGEKFVLATDNSVGATIELRERLYGSILSKKNILSGG